MALPTESPESPGVPIAPATFDKLVLTSPPPMEAEWVQYEKDANLPCPRRPEPPLERQPVYAAERRELSARMRAPGMRDEYLSHNITIRPLTVVSSLDGADIPLLAYRAGRNNTNGGDSDGDNDGDNDDDDSTVAVYIHGGGLHVGEADSEDLSCRFIAKETRLPGGSGGLQVLYSVGYRLMPLHPASTCVADCADAVRHVRAAHPRARLLLVGSSSGGELAALITQQLAEEALASEGAEAVQEVVQGVVLRCPVTSDIFQGDEYVPAHLRPWHTTAANLAFQTSQLGPMRRKVPRDGLARMPIEAPPAVLRALPPHWIQVCTNDMLYSDGICYAKALADAGVPVRIDIVRGWPHTFWLPAPWMARALEANRAMLRGLAWVAS